MPNLSNDLVISLNSALEAGLGDEVQKILDKYQPRVIEPLPMPTKQLIPDELARMLMKAGAERRVCEIIAVLKDLQPQLAEVALPQRNMAVIMSYATWLWASDLEHSLGSFAKTLLERFKAAVLKEDMTLSELTHLNFTEGLFKLKEERYEEAIGCFELAERVADRAEQTELQTIARYYLARGHLKCANYDKALSYVQQARGFDVAAGLEKRLAITDSMEGLVQLLRGETDQAEKLFHRAETALKGHEAENRVECGNLCLFRGRILRRRGQYEAAMQKFREGIQHYELHDENHRNIARARVHLAHVYRLIAREELEKAERVEQDKQKIQRYQYLALEQLLLAEKYYDDAAARQHQGLGKVHYTRALVYLDKEQIEDAQAESDKAFRLGHKKSDNLVMAKARIMQCRLALRARMYTLDTLKLAQDAMLYANRTQYPRLQIRALIWLGQALLRVLEDVAGARKCWKNAKEMMREEDKDDLRRVLDQLGNDLKKAPDREGLILSLTAAAVHNFIPSYVKEDVQENTLNGSFDYRQIIDEIEERILQYLLAREGNPEQVKNKWHLNADRIRDMNRRWKLTEQSLQMLDEKLSGSPELLRSLAQKRKLPAHDPDQLARVQHAILSALKPLKDQSKLGQASFLREVKLRIGREETQVLKEILVGKDGLAEKSKVLVTASERHELLKGKSD